MPPNPRSKDSEAALQRSLLGVAKAGLPDRTFTRGQGCWNCIHSKSPVDRWFDKRFQKLSYAKNLADQVPQGENDPRIVHIRRQVEQIDALIAQQQLFVCAEGRLANGEPIGDFVASAFLCSRWSGRDGASLARSADGKLDDLPEELREKIDGPEPLSISKFNELSDDDAYDYGQGSEDAKDGQP